MTSITTTISVNRISDLFKHKAGVTRGFILSQLFIYKLKPRRYNFICA